MRGFASKSTMLSLHVMQNVMAPLRKTVIFVSTIVDFTVIPISVRHILSAAEKWFLSTIKFI